MAKMTAIYLSFWSPLTFKKDAGGWDIRTLGLQSPASFITFDPLNSYFMQARSCNCNCNCNI